MYRGKELAVLNNPSNVSGLFAASIPAPPNFLEACFPRPPLLVNNRSLNKREDPLLFCATPLVLKILPQHLFLPPSKLLEAGLPRPLL